MNKELKDKLNHLELFHKNCLNFMGKAFYEKSRDQLDSALYFHDIFNEQLKEIRELIQSSSQLAKSKNTKPSKYNL